MQPSPPGTYVILVALVSSSWQTEVRGCYCTRTMELILTTWSLVYMTAHCWWSWALWRDECLSINLELISMTRMYILLKFKPLFGGIYHITQLQLSVLSLYSWLQRLHTVSITFTTLKNWFWCIYYNIDQWKMETPNLVSDFEGQCWYFVLSDVPLSLYRSINPCETFFSAMLLLGEFMLYRILIVRDFV